MLAMVALFPGGNWAWSLAPILLIFTGQVWKYGVQFYALVEKHSQGNAERATIYRFRPVAALHADGTTILGHRAGVESMMSVAGGWFALMVCEMFVLAARFSLARI